MLILSRGVGETVVIDGGIKVTVSSIRDGVVRLGFIAPPKVNIVREELIGRKPRPVQFCGDDAE